MADVPIDPQWARLLSVAGHEVRNSLTTLVGWIRMLQGERAGPLSEQQKHMLTEAEKSCGRLSTLVAEMSDLASLEEGTSSFKRAGVDLPALLNDTIARLPGLPDHRNVQVELTCEETCAINGDPSRLKSAFTSLLNALRKELVTSDTLYVRLGTRKNEGQAVTWVAFGDADNIDRLAGADPASLETFDEWRGGCGLSLPVARRVIAAHNGRLWSAGDQTKAGAVVMLPCK